MEELKKALTGQLKNKKASTAMDLIIEDVLKRNGVEDGKLKNLSPEQKQKIKTIFQELQTQINDLLE